MDLHKLSWQTFFRVCTEEMDDLSLKATKLVIEYCLEILDEVERTIPGKATLARLQAALTLTDVASASKWKTTHGRTQSPIKLERKNLLFYCNGKMY